MLKLAVRLQRNTIRSLAIMIADVPDGFVSALLDNMEPSEKQDFQDLEKSLMRQEQQAMQQRWQNMWDEKVAEQKASWQDLPVNFSARLRLNCCDILCPQLQL